MERARRAIRLPEVFLGMLSISVAVVLIAGMAADTIRERRRDRETISVIGSDAERLLNKVTAVDLRERTLPVGGCCQGPLFGVNTLFGRFANRFDLHVCTDSAEFFWEVLLDAGAEFGLRPAGTEDIR